jgi:micrococcal nuclease
MATVVVIVMAATAALGSDVMRITAAEAADHVGEIAEVCGSVASAAHIGSVKGEPTFLNLERPYPDQLFTVVIWGSTRGQFDGRPERMFDGKQICVTGKIDRHRGKPQIVVDDPGQIVLVNPTLGGAELTETERILVKALLSSLGHEANYGSGEWDEEAVAATAAFQEGAGLAPSGEPGPATLRALADAALNIEDADRDLVIRLLLFEMARRGE